jgi:L-2-hydroxyglutarate oxidase LhgO
MDQVDCVVVGAGVVGLAVARALAQIGREVWVLDAADAIGSHALMQSLQSDLERAGGTVVLRCELAAADLTSARPQLTLADGTQLACKLLVNAAGLNAPTLAKHFNGLAPEKVPPAFYAKGNYFALVGKAPFKHLVYPVPEPGGLGIHLTLDLGGQAKFGPDVQWLDSATDYTVDTSRAHLFQAQIRKYWPGLPDHALTPAYAGIRPKISGPSDAPADFLIQGPADHGHPGLINLFGIESPGLTSALAIGEEVLRLL